ncbi:MAG: hypothetical protein CVV24_02000 [Ignavibacteriae bacterium HGW-Ignavibacteriae-3]|nr:MAG: hypothetical protein CVV24_02000 [Ignavibacteriae bacterium HGW-Ignavibacteriae-3]
MKRIITVILLVAFVPTGRFASAQSFKIGLRYEPGVMFTSQNSRNEIIPVLFCLSINLIVQPNEWLSFIVRPGFLLVDEQYSGFEIGGFVKLMLFDTKYYSIIGLNNHSNKDTGHNTSGSYGKEILYKSIGLGFQADSKFCIDICYYWTSDKEYAYSRIRDGLTYSNIVSKQMNGILKLGIDLSWDIL